MKYYDKKTLDFLLFDTHKAEELCELPYYADHSKETFNMILESASNVADKYMYPYLKSIDTEQPELVDGEVKVHPIIREYLTAMGETGLISADFSYEDGGAQVPFVVSTLAGFILMAANNGMMYVGLTSGAARLISSFGSEKMKKDYLPNMLNGSWQGTMCLTEPQAGSSLSDIVTTAEPIGDESFKIKGQKIFISGGDHDGCDNVVHLLIGRIKGAPLGTKGISLFVVPKILADGTRNDITNVGIYHKLGQRGVPAMHLEFGDNCIGYLVGQENKGLSYMFQMMNEARIGVGTAGVAISSAAYHAALQYAKERPQSRRLNKKNELDSPQVPIIQHPDIRRSLLLQKAAVEGSLSLIIQTAKYFDLAHGGSKDKEKYELLLELLTPVTKTYPCESGMRVTSEALQCFGGYGFTEDFPAEQFYRDIRITPIYEGTTAIQSQDLLGRKVMLGDGKALIYLAEEIKESIAEADKYDNLTKYSSKLGSELRELNNVTMHLIGIAQSGDTERFLSDASLYMEVFSNVTIAWQWLKIATAAELEKSNLDELFYLSKIETMKYFYHYELPKTSSLIKRLMDDDVITILKDKEIFNA